VNAFVDVVVVKRVGGGAVDQGRIKASGFLTVSDDRAGSGPAVADFQFVDEDINERVVCAPKGHTKPVEQCMTCASSGNRSDAVL